MAGDRSCGDCRDCDCDRAEWVVSAMTNCGR